MLELVFSAGSPKKEHLIGLLDRSVSLAGIRIGGKMSKGIHLVNRIGKDYKLISASVKGKDA